MPGKVLEIKVNKGDSVYTNQTVIVMEAMKMELSLKATTDTSVSEICVARSMMLFLLILFY